MWNCWLLFRNWNMRVKKQSLCRPEQVLRLQELELPRISKHRHMKLARLPALRTSRLYRPGNIPGTHVCCRPSRTQGHSAAWRINSLKSSNDTIGNRTHVLQAYSAVVYNMIYLLTAIGGDTRWQKYSTHLHTNNTQNDTKQIIHRTTQQFWKSADRAPSWLVLPWHLPYNWGKKHGITYDSKVNISLCLVKYHVVRRISEWGCGCGRSYPRQ